MKSKLFFGGVPTGPEVDKVLDLWRQMKAGDKVFHDAIYRVTGINPRTSRYRTVINAARKKFCAETGGVHMLSVSGEGYLYPTGMDQLEMGTKAIRRGAKMMRRGTSLTISVSDDRLDDRGKTARDFAVRRMHALSDFARTEARRITMAIVPTALPPANGDGQ